MNDTKQHVAFIGTGIMGAPMARHLIEAGYPVTVYNRTASKCAPLVEAGARLAASPADAAAQADVVITMVGFPEEVEELYLARGGLVEAARSPAPASSTCPRPRPELARDIAEVAAVSGRRAFDAPVTGGQQGAQAGTLTVFCGATEEDVAPVRPVLEAFSSKVFVLRRPRQGPDGQARQPGRARRLHGRPGGGASRSPREGGLDVAKTLEALARRHGGLGGARRARCQDRWQATIAPGFMVEHYVKDLGLALEVAEDEELTLPGVETANQLYGLLAEIGGARMGTQAIDLVYSDERACAEHGLDWSLLTGARRRGRGRRVRATVRAAAAAARPRRRARPRRGLHVRLPRRRGGRARLRGRPVRRARRRRGLTVDVIIVTMLFGVLGIVIGWKVGSVWGSLAETDRQYWMRNLAVVLVGIALSAVVAATGLTTLMGLTVGLIGGVDRRPQDGVRQVGRRLGRSTTATSG